MIKLMTKKRGRPKHKVPLRMLRMRATPHDWKDFLKMMPHETATRFDFLFEKIHTVALLEYRITQLENKIKNPDFELEYGEHN